jgi:hypothetical protein
LGGEYTGLTVIPITFRDLRGLNPPLIDIGKEIIAWFDGFTGIGFERVARQVY